MNPVRTAWMDVVYKGIDPEVGDLHCYRAQDPLSIITVWEPTEEEREILANGGRVALGILYEPIPPGIGMGTRRRVIAAGRQITRSR